MRVLAQQAASSAIVTLHCDRDGYIERIAAPARLAWARSRFAAGVSLPDALALTASQRATRRTHLSAEEVLELPSLALEGARWTLREIPQFDETGAANGSIALLQQDERAIDS
ncbi:MAG: hypothetical protein V2I63_01935, partial [Pseudomonadales bacterium]|nr:hypothetical protein [Pseudomonadales bacterium]